MSTWFKGTFKDVVGRIGHSLRDIGSVSHQIAKDNTGKSAVKASRFFIPLYFASTPKQMLQGIAYRIKDLAEALLSFVTSSSPGDGAYNAATLEKIKR